MKNINIPSKEVILSLHDVVLEISGGLPGVRDMNVVTAACQRPHTYQGYADNYDVHTAGALLLDSLARNHAFVEGNKRTALVTVLLTYTVNGIYLKMPLFMNNEFEELVLWVVNQKPSIDEIDKRLRSLVKKYQESGFQAIIDKLKARFFR
ncbi:MAG: type II toxin-antitoxin system death-on-curing family toxin [Candidatus Saccharibacteria bacterium]|nr:type II toxin-antitoxin system death-on-curing family toxin [Candidatus Saccharibacteria bacterium]